MSSKHPALSEERQKAVFDEFVDMYIKNGGIYPTARDIKKNPYITEEEVAILRKKHLLDDRNVRTAAEKKTGEKYKPHCELNRERAKERTKAEMAKRAEDKRAEEILRGIEEAAKRAEKQAEEKKKEVNTLAGKGKYTEETIKKVLREFAAENLRWPTDAEIHNFRREGKPGWPSSAEINRRFGNRENWAKLVFPEGLPDGFVQSHRGGARKASIKAIPVEAPISAPAKESPTETEKSVTMDDFKKHLEKILKIITERDLLELITMSTNFQMESRFRCEDYYGKDISFTFKVK